MRQGAEDLVRYQDSNLEELRALVALKASLGSPELAALVGGVDNPVVQRVFLEVVNEAPRERAALEEVVRGWTRAAQEGFGATALLDDSPSTREIVQEWTRVLDLASARARAVAERAPTPDLRLRLELLADADALRARTLKALL